MATPVFEMPLPCEVNEDASLCTGIPGIVKLNVSRTKANTATTRPKIPATAAKVCMFLPISTMKSRLTFPTSGGRSPGTQH